jgi:hypothetical protein
MLGDPRGARTVESAVAPAPVGEASRG